MHLFHALTRFLFFIGLFLLVACAPELELEERVALSPDQIVQSYSINVYNYPDGGSFYSVHARFSTPDGTAVVLAPGDSITLNGQLMTAGSSGSNSSTYSVSGTDRPESFTLVYTHSQGTYTNVVQPTRYLPQGVSQTLSRSQPFSASFTGVPAGVTVGGFLYPGSSVGMNYVRVTTEVSGGGKGQVWDQMSQATLGANLLLFVSWSFPAIQEGLGTISLSVDERMDVTVTN